MRLEFDIRAWNDLVRAEDSHDGKEILVRHRNGKVWAAGRLCSKRAEALFSSDLDVNLFPLELDISMAFQSPDGTTEKVTLEVVRGKRPGSFSWAFVS